MDSHDQPFIARPEAVDILRRLGMGGRWAVHVVGPPGSGKTTLLRMIEAALSERGRAVFSVSCRGVRADELGSTILAAVRDSRFSDLLAGSAILRSSAGSPGLRETTEILRVAGTRMSGPVLLLDGLDEADNPARMASAVEELVLDLEEWAIVVTSRPGPAGEFAHTRRLRRFVLGPLAQEEAAALVRTYAPDMSDAEVDRIVDLSGGSPLLLRISAQGVGSTPVADLSSEGALTEVFRRLLDDALRDASDPDLFGRLVDDLALFGGRCDLETLSARLGLSVRMLRRLVLDSSPATAVILFEESSVTFFHDAFRDFVLTERIRFSAVRLADLKFGSEEAEKDDLLAETYVESRGFHTILDQHQSLVVGDRGSGKSAIFRKLSDDDTLPVRICPIANSGDLLQRIVAPESWQDAQALRAAWLVVVAAAVAGELPSSAPKDLRGKAADLRVALGLSTKRPGLLWRAVRTAVRPFLGTKLSFAVGPVTLEANLPIDSAGRNGKALLDVDSFLGDADALLGAAGRRVVVMVDRVDETFKYDRDKQEPVVQALLQAEGRITQSDNIGLIIFLRTDLFELYDIQEKNKLVSRTLTLDWTEEEWLQVLVRRVLANKQLRWLADRMLVYKDDVSIRTALSELFPAEVENQPIDRWLVDSLRNGNGDISPRLAVLLLHLARKRADESEATVSGLPIFSPVTLADAMTQLSDLSFSEVVNDFKVASSFVLNCRAGKLETFTLESVANLFDEAEGTTSEQVRLLERLGFLERVVRTTDTGVESLFRIPKLYTRCWDYA